MRKLEAGQPVAFVYNDEGTLNEFAGTIERTPVNTSFLLRDGNSVYKFEQLGVKEWLAP